MSAPRTALVDDTGSGSVLAVAIAATAAALTALMVCLVVALGVKHQVAADADSAALAAADVASGWAPGYPCVVARMSVERSGSALQACAVDGLFATVTASRLIWGVDFAATARAGPQQLVEGSSEGQN